MARRTKKEMAEIREAQAKINAILTGPKAEMAAFRAVLAIWKKQTETEKECFDTHVNNGVGFAKADAAHGTALAEWMMGFGWNEEWTMKDAARDGKFRRRPAGQVRRAGGQMHRVDLAKHLAWKYRKQLRMIAYGI